MRSVMIEFSMRRHETRNADVQPPMSGNIPSGWRVHSNAKIADARRARDAPANIAAIPTSAATRMSTPNEGTITVASEPSNDPMPPPIVKSGASVPPLVPLPSEMDHEMNFAKQK